MENENENIDSQNDETEVTVEETTEATEEKEVAGEELSEREKQFLARAKKAEAKLKATKGQPEVKPEVKTEAIDKPSDNDLREEVFFLKNKELEEQKDLIKSFQKPGQSLEEVVKNPLIKKTLDDLKALKESQTSKSVIHNNSRISDGGSDEAKAFKEAQGSGNWAEYISKYRQ